MITTEKEEKAHQQHAVAVGNPFFFFVSVWFADSDFATRLSHKHGSRKTFVDGHCACVDNRSVLERLCGLTPTTRARLLWVVVVYWG